MQATDSLGRDVNFTNTAFWFLSEPQVQRLFEPQFQVSLLAGVQLASCQGVLSFLLAAFMLSCSAGKKTWEWTLEQVVSIFRTPTESSFQDTL